MEKVKCVKCGSIGYTAAPKFVRCSECGGRHEIIKISKDYPKMPFKKGRWPK